MGKRMRYNIIALKDKINGKLCYCVTLVWFLPSVDEDVPFQTTFPCEPLLTVVTLVWFLPSVSEDVSL